MKQVRRPIHRSSARWPGRKSRASRSGGPALAGVEDSMCSRASNWLWRDTSLTRRVRQACASPRHSLALRQRFTGQFRQNLNSVQ